MNNKNELNSNINDIPIISKSYKDDMKILDYCKQNINDKKCECVLPSSKINKYEINSFNPYYCWYAPCKNSDIYKTSLIVHYQKSCNIVSCNVEANDIFIDHSGALTINNNCHATIAVNNAKNISEELLDKSLNKNYNLPNIFLSTYFPVILGLIFIIL